MLIHSHKDAVFALRWTSLRWSKFMEATDFRHQVYSSSLRKQLCNDFLGSGGALSSLTPDDVIAMSSGLSELGSRLQIYSRMSALQTAVRVQMRWTFTRRVGVGGVTGVLRTAPISNEVVWVRLGARCTIDYFQNYLGDNCSWRANHTYRYKLVVVAAYSVQ